MRIAFRFTAPGPTRRLGPDRGRGRGRGAPLRAEAARAGPAARARWDGLTDARKAAPDGTYRVLVGPAGSQLAEAGTADPARPPLPDPGAARHPRRGRRVRSGAQRRPHPRGLRRHRALRDPAGGGPRRHRRPPPLPSQPRRQLRRHLRAQGGQDVPLLAPEPPGRGGGGRAGVHRPGRRASSGGPATPPRPPATCTSRSAPAAAASSTPSRSCAPGTASAERGPPGS